MASQIPAGIEQSNVVAETDVQRRNPYEMRFDLLHLAKDILEGNAHMAREDKAKDRKTYYTTDEVLETAEKLNKFISNK